MSGYVFNYAQYQKQINPQKSYNFTIILLVIILLLGSCIFLQPRKKFFTELYFIQIGEFQTYQLALNHSQEISSVGGAGYIYFDKTYHVLAGFYSKYNDAKSVLENIKKDLISAKIFSITTKQFSEQSNLNKNQNNRVKNFVEKSEDVILKLEMLCSKFFTDSISFNELSIHIKNLKKEFDEICDSFLVSFKNNSKHNLTKEYVLKISNTINQLIKFNEQEITISLRYHIIDLVINRHQFLLCF